MPEKLTHNGKEIKRGANMVSGTGWRLVKVSGGKSYFVGSLIGTINLDKTKRLAVFSVPKNKEASKDS
jgi:hypothetical protein